jgi:ATP-dependent Clp protease ATP-binding subunit ClpA
MNPAVGARRFEDLVKNDGIAMHSGVVFAPIATSIQQANKQLGEKGVKLEVTDAAKDLLGEKGYDEVFGARPLRRVIQDMVEDKLSDSLLRSPR